MPWAVNGNTLVEAGTKLYVWQYPTFIDRGPYILLKNQRLSFIIVILVFLKRQLFSSVIPIYLSLIIIMGPALYLLNRSVVIMIIQ